MNKKQFQEQKKLKNAWVLDHAYAMMEEFNMDRSEAFRQAHLVCNLLEKLGEGEVTFRYEKKDSNDRLARGTLCHGISAEYDNYHYGDDSRKKKDKYLRLEQSYWDLDKQAFRSFSIASVKEIVNVVIKSKSVKKNG